MFSEHCGTGGATCSRCGRRTSAGSPTPTRPRPWPAASSTSPTAGSVTPPWASRRRAHGCQPLWRGPLPTSSMTRRRSPTASLRARLRRYIYAFRVAAPRAAKCTPAVGSWARTARAGRRSPAGCCSSGRRTAICLRSRPRAAGSRSALRSGRRSPSTTPTFSPGPRSRTACVFITNYADRLPVRLPRALRRGMQAGLAGIPGPAEPRRPRGGQRSGVRGRGQQRQERGHRRLLGPLRLRRRDLHAALARQRRQLLVPSGPVVAGGDWATGGPQNGPANLYAFGLPVPGAARAGPFVVVGTPPTFFCGWSAIDHKPALR